LKLVAHCMPARKAVWWTCMYAQHTAPCVVADPNREAVLAAQAWGRRRADEDRRAAYSHAERSNFQTLEA
jgi:hypothetical protein